MKEELICRLNNLIAFIENKDNYFAMFGHVIESCSAANEINRLVWDSLLKCIVLYCYLFSLFR